MTTVITVLLILLLLVMIAMAIRDGRPFFADPLKLTVLIITVLVVLLTWAPIARGSIGR